MQSLEKFEKLGLKENLLKVLAELKFTNPTDIQEKSIPLVLEGKNVIGSASTGSGKTLAFGAGIFNITQIGKGVQALVLVPTRELCEQDAKSLKFFSKNYGFNIAEVYGGVSLENQVRKIKISEIVVGTPGRILDHLRRGSLNFERLKILVLDEADRMVDMGFLPDVEKIIQACPKERQNLMFSATISQDVEYIARKYMGKTVNISAESNVDPSKLEQIFYDVPTSVKFSLLFHLLKEEKSDLVMVFCNTRRNADTIANNLKRFGLEAVAIHGGLAQNKRSNIMENFHSSKTKILICTDVAARGLDIKGVSHVYNYDIPPSIQEYIHRIGRTARAGKDGKAVNIISKNDYMNFQNIREDSKTEIKQKELPEFETVNPRFSQDKYSDSRRSFGGRSSGRSGGRSFGGRDRETGRFSRGRDSDRSYGRSSGGRDRGTGRSFGGRSDSRSSRYSSGSRDYKDSRDERSHSRGRSFGGRSSGRSGGRSFGGRDSSGGRSDSRRSHTKSNVRRYRNER
ncbi:DEAD/DEAH box helicase [Candidatus Pacearchaeota archaeon]|nr:DEAD/DEAH box helicase [Candidatus Pacearchaeota archaeon]